MALDYATLMDGLGGAGTSSGHGGGLFRAVGDYKLGEARLEHAERLADDLYKTTNRQMDLDRYKFDKKNDLDHAQMLNSVEVENNRLRSAEKVADKVLAAEMEKHRVQEILNRGTASEAEARAAKTRLETLQNETDFLKENYAEFSDASYDRLQKAKDEGREEEYWDSAIGKQDQRIFETNPQLKLLMASGTSDKTPKIHFNRENGGFQPYVSADGKWQPKTINEGRYDDGKGDIPVSVSTPQEMADIFLGTRGLSPQRLQVQKTALETQSAESQRDAAVAFETGENALLGREQTSIKREGLDNQRDLAVEASELGVKKGYVQAQLDYNNVRKELGTSRLAALEGTAKLIKDHLVNKYGNAGYKKFLGWSPDVPTSMADMEKVFNVSLYELQKSGDIPYDLSVLENEELDKVVARVNEKIETKISGWEARGDTKAQRMGSTLEDKAIGLGKGVAGVALNATPPGIALKTVGGAYKQIFEKVADRVRSQSNTLDNAQGATVRQPKDQLGLNDPTTSTEQVVQRLAEESKSRSMVSMLRLLESYGIPEREGVEIMRELRKYNSEHN